MNRGVTREASRNAAAEMTLSSVSAAPYSGDLVEQSTTEHYRTVILRVLDGASNGNG